jgi:hypothetical protein
MSRPRPRKHLERKTRWGRTPIIAATVVLAVAILAAAIFLRAGAVDSGFESLKGRWVRLDGGYVLEIRAVDSRGTIDAAYLNPRPINVARAEATRDGSMLKVFVELRAPNYPGSTYTLTHDPKTDQLGGAYFQAVQRQTFDVVFYRAK